MLDRPLELYQEMELLRLVDQFFDRAVYYAARGHERAMKVGLGTGNASGEHEKRV